MRRARKVIRRCIKNGYMQQVLTLYTEWLPEEILERGICKPKDASIARDAALDGLSFGRNRQQQLIIAYQGRKSTEAQFKAAVDEYCKQLRLILKNLSNPFLKASVENADYGRLKQFASEYNRGRKAFQNVKLGKMKVAEFKGKFPMLLQTIYDVRSQAATFAKSFPAFVRSIDYDRIALIVS